ncbi:MAG TPA: oxidoreductase [Flavisolibacter sp.]|jgi:NAD(P)-dependent dehydrogenase (short-subunit alcohol dehydrogenase family)|nr:oxidoreductase [Flavisolibacter sp.]
MAKTWFITGASSGFGAELAKAIIESGDKVAATFRKTEQASLFSQQYKEKGLGVVLDVTQTERVQAALQQAIDKFGHIDVLVNNAGYGTIGAIEEFSLEEIREQMETNFFGAVAVTKAILATMREQKSGHIVQISSQAGFRATAGFGVYNASKFALEGFSEALAQEVAPFSIKVTIVEPGPFRTQFLAGSMKMPQNRLDIYQKGPVAQMYQYQQKMDGNQEGDPVKAAKAIVDYVQSGKENLRLPLGKRTIQGMRAKLASVEKDIAANESIAVSTIFQ